MEFDITLQAVSPLIALVYPLSPSNPVKSRFVGDSGRLLQQLFLSSTIFGNPFDASFNGVASSTRFGDVPMGWRLAHRLMVGKALVVIDNGRQVMSLTAPALLVYR
jgi:hypothetical protein